MDHEITELIAALGSDELETRKQAQARLIDLGSAVVEPLIKVVKSSESRPAWNAAQVLGELRDPRAFQTLIAAVRSPNALLGSAAAKAVLKYQTQDALPHLIEALPYAPMMTQQSIVLILQQAHDKRAVEILITLLTSTPSPVLRTAVIKVLGELGDPQAAPMIRSFLNDADHHVRDWAAQVVQKLEETS